MEPTDIPRMRKRLMSEQVSRCAERPGEVDIASLATFAYSSEHPDHPLEHLIDGRGGPGGHPGLDRRRPPPLGERQAAALLRWSACFTLS